MPRNNKTGPRGQGPGTGRGMGACEEGVGSTATMTGIPGHNAGYGRDGGRRRGRCAGNGYTGNGYSFDTPKMENNLEQLESEMKSLEERIKDIHSHINKLKEDSSEADNNTD
ncbi:MAG: DUF5320 domain-containing protein [Fibrobacteria bacterium]|nr:DUF5320 domain-containing protein [Fibrobacteria bacterium]